MKHKQSILKLNWLLVGAFLLSACNFPLTVSLDSTIPTVDGGEETSDSEGSDSETQPTPTEEPPAPTDTPEPTPTATVEPPTDTPAPTGCTNFASFVSLSASSHSTPRTPSPFKAVLASLRLERTTRAWSSQAFWCPSHWVLRFRKISSS